MFATKRENLAMALEEVTNLRYQQSIKDYSLVLREIYRTNRSGPGFEPCGTLDVKCRSEAIGLQNLDLHVRSTLIASIHSTVPVPLITLYRNKLKELAFGNGSTFYFLAVEGHTRSTRSEMIGSRYLISADKFLGKRDLGFDAACRRGVRDRDRIGLLSGLDGVCTLF
ncbi:hypothetical protein Trydic_g2281 [Trypoxylus dichotomus]